MNRTDPPSFGELEGRINKLEDDIKHPAKDAWDKLGAASGLVSGILVALIGFYATNLYDRHSKQAEETDRRAGVNAVELQTVEKFFPHLFSKDDTEKQAAIEVISYISKPELAAKIAKIVGGVPARAALTKIASESSEAQSSVGYALTDLFKYFGKATALVELTCKLNDGSVLKEQGTAAVVTTDGFALTTYHLFNKDCTTESIEIGLRIGDSPRRIATLVKADSDLDLALLKLPASNYPSVKIGSDPIRLGDAVTILGYPAAANGLTAFADRVSSTSGPGGRFIVDLTLPPGLGGAPIFNSQGEVIGVIIGTNPNLPSQSVGVPIRFAQPLLTMAGAS